MHRRVVLYLLAIALFSLTGCQKGSKPEPSFIVMFGSGPPRATTLVPAGFGWTPKSQIEISVWGEPKFEDGEVVTTHEWKSLGVVTADDLGMFGFNSGALSFVVQRTIPGAPPQWLAQPIFLAREKGTGTVRFFTGFKDVWFTF